MPSWAAMVLAPQTLLPEQGDQDWYYRVYEWRNAQIVATGRTPSLADFAEATGTPSRVSLENLVRPRSGWRKADRAWLLQSGRPDAFEFREDEQFGTVEVLFEVARARGGENLLVWTCAGAVHVLVHRSAGPGARPLATRTSFRLEPYPSGRHPRGWERLRRALEDSVLAPDLDRLAEQWAGPRIDPSAWFAGLGVPGVVEVDPGAVWADFRRAADHLLQGEPPPAPLLERVNAHLPKKAALEAKPRTKPGATARRVADAAASLARAVGPGLPELFGAADLAGAIAGGEALGRLTTGADEAGLGASASFGRLLAHYPPQVLREPLFHALSGLRTEAANGHPYVPAWFCLAEHTASAGFTLAVYPADRARSFRKAFGLSEGEEDVVRGGRRGEAFVDLPGLLKTEPVPALEAWFAKEGCDGEVVRAEPSGQVRVTRFQGGRGLPEAPVEREEACRLDPRGLQAALGLPDVLEPGEFGAGPPAARPNAARRETAHALLAGLPFPEAEPDLEFMQERFGSVDSGLSFEDLVRRKEPTLACRLAFPREEDAEILLQDLLRLELFARLAPWREGPDLWLAGHALPLGLLSRVAGDVPPGTRAAFTARAAVSLLVPGRVPSGLTRFHYEVGD